MADIASAFAQRARRRHRRGHAVLDRRRARRSIESHRRDLGQSPEAATRPGGAPCVPRNDRAIDGAGHGATASCSIPTRKLLSIGYRVAEGTLDPNCYDLLASEARLASFIAIAKGDVPARHWFHLGRAVTPIATWRRADLLVGIDVRIPDALAGHARAGGKPARADQPADRAAADRLRRVARPAVGHLGIRLQHPRPGADLPILELRRSRPRAEARPRRERRGGALRDGARQHGRSAAAARNFARLAGAGACGRYGFYEALDYTPSRLPRMHASRSCAPSWRTIRA